MFRFVSSGRGLPGLTGIAITFLIILLSLSPKGMGQWIQRLDYLLYDWRFAAGLALEPQTTGGQPIVILDVDERSLATEGRWPWSRFRLAELVDRLAEAGAVVTAFDVVLSEPEPNPLDELQQRLKSHGEGSEELNEDWRPLVDADARFVESLPATDVVLGNFFLDESGVSVGALPKPVYRLSAEEINHLVVITRPGYAAPLTELQQAAADGGFVTTLNDADGAIRRAPLLIRYGNELYPSLALATLTTYLFDRVIQLEKARIGDVEVIRGVGLGNMFARTDASGQVIVPYRGGRKTFPYFSATDVLQGNIPDGALEGAIVLVGTSAIGLADLRTMPLETQYPGVEVHATIIDAFLNDGFPYRPEWEAGATLTVLVLLGALLSLWLPSLGPLSAVLLSTLAAALLVAGNLALWVNYRLDLPVAAALILAVSLTMLNLGWGFTRENRSRRLLKGMFDQYVPPAHIDRMVKDPDAYHFTGESKELSVLFSDIRSFTSISEGLSAADLKALLNSYFTPVTKVIFDHEGTIDKYVGDMVMAFWGAPLDDERHASHAIAAALQMQQVTRKLSVEFVQRGWPQVAIGIGINTGLMNVGDMGSSYRRAYTVLGDAVNLGSRLESLTKFYGVEILVSEFTREQAGDYLFRFIDRIQVKGKEEAVDVYEPVCLAADAGEELLTELDDYSRARGFYLQQQWDKASVLFTHLAQAHGAKIYHIYLERIAELKDQPLPGDWDGVYRHTSK
ncbi:MULTISPECIES: CHASE2 domain-containing protein [unclassified Thalassolituus]|uniref:CHASE2 domain-containing protein n=1 Tax=unclassified Thalassolituus TaxID=2624967 RepID=UPI0025D2BC08|nr:MULTISPECIES: adenylate/guanylate cyclase domain-containing protein [unclassified Thalassolituus]